MLARLMCVTEHYTRMDMTASVAPGLIDEVLILFYLDRRSWWAHALLHGERRSRVGRFASRTIEAAHTRFPNDEQMKHLPGGALGMPKSRILNVLSLLAIAFIIPGCFWSGPWPRVDVNIEGLGEGELAKFVGRNTYYDADGLKQRTKKFIIEQTSAKGISRDDAEALGLQCAPPPSKECSYSGEYWVRSDQRYVPREGPDYGTRAVYHVDVRLSYLKPHDAVVQARKRYVPDE